MSELILLSNVRLSFPHLAEPQRQKNDQTGQDRISYNCELLMSPTHPGYIKTMEVVNKMALEKWTVNAANILQHIHSDKRLRGFGKGDDKINQKTFLPYDGYAGMVYITAGKGTMPQIIDTDGKPVDPANTMACQMVARKMYGGCYVNVAIKPWLQENKHGRGVRFDLVAVQFFADGQPFGEGATDASGLFGATPAAAAPMGMPGAPAAPAWATPGATAPAMPGLPFPGAPAPAPQPAWAPPAVGGLPPFLS